MNYNVIKQNTVGDLTTYRKGVLNVIETDLYDILQIKYTDTPLVKLKDQGIFLKKDSAPLDMKDCFMLPKGIGEVSSEGILGVKIKMRLTADIMTQVRKVLQVIYDLRRTEGSVMVTYKPESGFGMYIPKQRITAASVTIEPEDIDKPLLDGFKIAAFIHSHPFSGHAFLSGTDHANASNLSYVPIMSVNFRPDKLPVGILDMYNFGVPECEFHDIPIMWEDLVEPLPDTISIDKEERLAIEELLKDKIPAVKQISNWWAGDYDNFGRPLKGKLGRGKSASYGHRNKTTTLNDHTAGVRTAEDYPGMSWDAPMEIPDDTPACEMDLEFNDEVIGGVMQLLLKDAHAIHDGSKNKFTLTLPKGRDAVLEILDNISSIIDYGQDLPVFLSKDLCRMGSLPYKNLIARLGRSLELFLSAWVEVSDPGEWLTREEPVPMIIKEFMQVINMEGTDSINAVEQFFNDPVAWLSAILFDIDSDLRKNSEDNVNPNPAGKLYTNPAMNKI